MFSNKQRCKQRLLFPDKLKRNAKTQPWGLAEKRAGEQQMMYRTAE